MHELTELIERLVTEWVGGLEVSGYWGIFILMTIESSFIPFPSEIVMIPAGALVAQGKLNMAGSLTAGTAGSLTGALVNYYLALWLGRSFLLKYGKYFFLPADKFTWAEKHWHQHGEMTTFVCRLLPAIRQLISIPAGLARMNLARFCFWTSFGAGLWVLVLTLTGYFFAEVAERWWASHKQEITIALFATGFVVVTFYLVRLRLKKKTPAPATLVPDAQP